MMSTPYRFTARGNSQATRPRLVSLWVLAGFAAVVLTPLVIAFPRQDLVQQAESATLGDPLAISYLTNLLRADPDNPGLRVSLAEHKIHLGELAGVPGLINPVLRSADQDWQMQGELAMYKYLTKEYSLSKPGSPRQVELMKQRRAVFVRLPGKHWPIQTLAYLAGQATSLHERDIGIRLYRKITESSRDYSAAWCADTAARVLGEGNYEIAAELYFSARDKEPTLQGQREFLMAGIRALMSNNLFAQAMQAADHHLGNLADDPDTLNFLIQVARAANDQERAARYARRMLHLSWLERAYAWFQQLDLGLIASANAASLQKPPPGSDGMGPYDQKKYQLAYDVFLENRNLADAFKVAEAAVRQRPGDAVWHKQLAQVAEWLNKPAIALREWRWLLHHNGGEPALLAVLRLAPALYDYDASLEAWKLKAADRALNDVQWNTLADLFEKADQQREGIKYFEERYNVDHSVLLLEIAARLAQRSGDEEHAIGLYLRMLKAHGFKTEWLLKAANLYFQKGQYQKAYDLLKKNRGNVDAKDVAYWKLLADQAWQLQRDEDAMKDYRHLADSGNLAREDFSRLVNLLGKSKPEEVAALAEASYRKFGDREMLLKALEIYVAQHDLVAQKRLFSAVAADRKAELSSNPRFLLLRAQYLQASGDFATAHAVFRRAAAMAPHDANTVNALLWFLIDTHDQAGLREMMAQIRARGEQQNPAYLGAYAAAYQVLDQPAQAVASYARQLRQNGQDFLWLVNYADALEQNQQAGMALRVRRQAWLQLHSKPQGKPGNLPYSPDMLAAARLSMLDQPGDPGLTLVGSVLRQDRLVRRDTVTDDRISELVLGWAASHEQSSNAKAWLWRRYGRSLARPLWGDAMVALADNDSDRLDHLLAGQADGMSLLVRHDAASALEQVHHAQSIAFDGLSANPDNDEAHLRLTEDALATAGFINVELRNQEFGTLHDIVQSAQVELPLTHHMRVATEFRQTRQHDDSPSDLGDIPATESIAGLALKIHRDTGDTEIGLRRRNEFDNTLEARAIHATDIQPRVHLQVGAEMNAEATEANELRVFAMRNRIDAALRYTFSKREYLNVQPAYSRYNTQPGDYLGSGAQLSWELGHHFNTEAPDLRVAAIGIHTRFRSEEAAVLTLPENTNVYGACFGFVEDYRQTYTKAWRPYFDACATHNDLSGGGYIVKFGLTGAVAGHDQLSAAFNQEDGGVNVVNGVVREVKLNYRYFFD